MKNPRSDHQYGAHPVILPPTDQDRHDGADIDLSVRLSIYRKLQEMRQFEKRAYDLFMRQLVKGTSHLSLGMEAISAGFGAAMRHDAASERRPANAAAARRARSRLPEKRPATS